MGSNRVDSNRVAFAELIRLAEDYVRARFFGNERERLLANIAVFAKFIDYPDEREASHAMDKFLWFARKWDPEKCAPYIEIVRAWRCALGLPCLVHSD